MTNEKAIKWLKVEASYIEEDVGNGKEMLEAYYMAIEALEQTRWIPCSERLPEDCTEVFVYLFDRPSPYIAWIEDTHWYTEDFEIERENEPVAWMPLPEPYQGGESDAK